MTQIRARVLGYLLDGCAPIDTLILIHIDRQTNTSETDDRSILTQIASTFDWTDKNILMLALAIPLARMDSALNEIEPRADPGAGAGHALRRKARRGLQ